MNIKKSIVILNEAKRNEESVDPCLVGRLTSAWLRMTLIHSVIPPNAFGGIQTNSK